ncbi:hypothetical protein A3860_31525 [Niastella vici]|uniref:Uncharacterized protein n=1 Tax=Niastella vici TaxID=1703345 RepID=A0A1V9FTX1_9BACT|nr:hypothetical protein A3860_31525 [Niastella vici]
MKVLPMQLLKVAGLGCNAFPYQEMLLRLNLCLSNEPVMKLTGEFMKMVYVSMDRFFKIEQMKLWAWICRFQKCRKHSSFKS